MQFSRIKKWVNESLKNFLTFEGEAAVGPGLATVGVTGLTDAVAGSGHWGPSVGL